MSALAESRSIAYSADTAGRAGRIACQVIRNLIADTGRVGYTIIVRNETTFDAHATAFVPDPLDLRERTILQSVIGAHAVFSTSVELELRDGKNPDLHVHVCGDDVEFALVAPTQPGGDGAQRPIALAAAAANGASRAGSGVLIAPAPQPLALRGETAEPRYGESGAHRARNVSAAHPAPPAVLDRSPSMLPILALFLALMATIAATVFRPQVAALDVPAPAAGTTALVVAYRATGIGTVTYHVTGPDAEAIAAGPLAPGSGTFAVTVPKRADDRTYLVRVAVDGPLGSALREAYVRVAAPLLRATVVGPQARPRRSSAPPQIRSLALDRALVAGGDTLNVYYDVAATSGSVALVDAGSQIAYGKSALSPSGHSAFVVPAAETQRFLTVVLTAQRGGVSTQSRIAVTVGPPASPTPLPDGSLPGDAAAADGAAAPVVLTPKTVRSGMPIRIDVRGASAGMTLVLSDNDGAELARRDNAADGTTVLDAPQVAAPVVIRLQASYAQGAGSETIVHSILVTPR